jgi:hypothetical protein
LFSLHDRFLLHAAAPSKRPQLSLLFGQKTAPGFSATEKNTAGDEQSG